MSETAKGSRFRCEPAIRRGEITNEMRVYEGNRVVAYVSRSRKTKRSVWQMRFRLIDSMQSFAPGEVVAWASDLESAILAYQWEVTP